MKNELIKIETNENGQQTVSGRELHEFLEVVTRYNDWFQRMTEYGFVSGIDYDEINIEVDTQKRVRTYKQKDHIMTIDMAKEISMLQRTEKGKQARRYFIACEKQLQAKQDSYLIADPIERAKAWIAEQEKVRALTTTVKVQEQQINELKPKASYYDTILQNKSLMTITQIAKDYGMTAREMNKLLHNYKIQYKQSNQWLAITTKWTQKGRLFLYAFLKNKNVLPLIEQD
jgi:anti-repressor protein